MENSLLRYVIVPRPERPAALLLPAESGWTLPFVDLPGHSFLMTGAINQAVHEELGLAIVIMRWLYRHETAPGVIADRVYAADNLSPVWEPPVGARWVSQAELAGLELAVPEHRAVLAAWFADTALPEPPPGRAPWACPGWFRVASTWIGEELERVGLKPTGPVMQLKTWSCACLLTVPTTGGMVYFKACSAQLSAEVGVTALLAREFPAHAPRLVVADQERRWFLTRAFTGPLLKEIADLSRWEEVLRAYAHMQIALMPRTGLLLAAGCFDRSLPVIAAELEQLLANTDLLVGDGRLTAAELAALRAMAPELRTCLQDLERLGPPVTLDHGDFHPLNIALDGERALIFDWSDVSVSHPFFGLVHLLDQLGSAAVPETDETRQRLRDAYLEPWTAQWPKEQLAAALHAAERIHRVHAATFVANQLLPGAETPDEWLWAPAYFLRKLLSAA
ncbi:MAG: hypothetical protein JWN15_709 [Firmicutes bacterium]|nr:hypothetical protein [Bacillota bacterium]